MNWVFENSAATGNDRMVLLVLADHSHDDGSTAYPSHSTIAHKAGGIADRTVRRCLVRLEAEGHIEREGWSAQHTISYRVLMRNWDDLPDLRPADRLKPPPTDPDKVSRLNPDRLSGSSNPDTRTSQAGNPDTAVSDEPSVNHPNNRTSSIPLKSAADRDDVETWVRSELSDQPQVFAVSAAERLQVARRNRGRAPITADCVRELLRKQGRDRESVERKRAAA